MRTRLGFDSDHFGAEVSEDTTSEFAFFVSEINDAKTFEGGFVRHDGAALLRKFPNAMEVMTATKPPDLHLKSANRDECECSPGSSPELEMLTENRQCRVLLFAQNGIEKRLLPGQAAMEISDEIRVALRARGKYELFQSGLPFLPRIGPHSEQFCHVIKVFRLDLRTKLIRARKINGGSLDPVQFISALPVLPCIRGVE